MKLHVVSDLHLSQGALALPETDADVVVLAGDVARPAQALDFATALPKPVLYVPGNHEFYGAGIDETRAALRRLCEGTNVRLLDDDVAVRAGVRFVGSTLWTDFAVEGDALRERAMQECARQIRDFSRIRIDADGGRAFTPADAAARFAAHARFLREALAAPFAGPTVVITHHAPSPRSIHPRFRESLLNACFVSDLEHLMDGARVPLWIHGHTHDSFDYAVNGTRILCNPRGYVRNGAVENPRFDAGLVIDLA